MYRFLVILFVFSGWCISATLAESVQNPDDIDPSVELLSGHLTSFDTSASILIKIDGAKSSDISISCEGIMQVIESRDVSSTIRWTPDVACRLPILTLRGSNYILPIRGFLPNLEAIADISTTTLRNTL